MARDMVLRRQSNCCTHTACQVSEARVSRRTATSPKPHIAPLNQQLIQQLITHAAQHSTTSPETLFISIVIFAPDVLTVSEWIFGGQSPCDEVAEHGGNCLIVKVG